MIDPCRMCYLYPDDCPTMNGCKSKTEYRNKGGKDVPIIRKQVRGSYFYDRGKKYEYNKNGIRREIR